MRIEILRRKRREQVGTGPGNPLLHLRCVGNQLHRLQNVGKKRRKLQAASRDCDVVFQLNEGDINAGAALTGDDELRDDLTLLEVSCVRRDVYLKVDLIVFEHVLVGGHRQHDVGLRELGGRGQIVGQPVEFLVRIDRNRVRAQAQPRIRRVDVFYRKEVKVSNGRQTLRRRSRLIDNAVKRDHQRVYRKNEPAVIDFSLEVALPRLQLGDLFVDRIHL